MNEDRWGDHGYSVRCVDCGEPCETRSHVGPVVCLPCAAGKKPSSVRVEFCGVCGNQRSRFDGDGCRACEWNRLDAELEAKHGPNWFKERPEVVNAE